MTDQEIRVLVQQELNDKHFAVTEVYLDIHSPVYHSGELVIERIYREDPDNLAIAYLPVVGEEFYFAFTVDIEAKEVCGIYTEPHHRVHFCAYSDTLTADDLKAMTSLTTTEAWSKGDTYEVAGRSHTCRRTFLDITPNPEPDTFDNKLKHLLDTLERDPAGVQELITKADGQIQVATHFHNGNTMLGGLHLDAESVRRMARLNVEIDFDLYADGNFFKDDREELEV